MAGRSRRQFVGLVGATAALAASPRGLEAQAPARGRDDRDDAGQRLGKTLRELNQAARLGITPEDLDRTEAYTTGALLEAARKLRPLVLPEGLDLPVVFRARRRS
jgi:hypothetical protein